MIKIVLGSALLAVAMANQQFYQQPEDYANARQGLGRVFSQYGILIFGPLLFLKLQLYLWKTCQKLNSTEFYQKEANFQFDKSLKITKANKYI